MPQPLCRIRRTETPAVTGLLQWMHHTERPDLPTPNYGYEKRQRELAKRRKKEEKLKARAERKAAGPGPDTVPDLSADATQEPGSVAAGAPDATAR